VVRLQEELGLPAPLAALLVTRDRGEPEEARRFLRPRLEELHPPEAMADLPLAVARIERAIERGETILVHGDYDVDGICAAALLTRWLSRLGGKVVPFVPHRLRDGYDLGPAGLSRAVEVGASLILTCDSGILAHDCIAQAATVGIEVIVTDHHSPGDSLPPALAVLNPNREDCRYPEGTLAGAGVAFKLCQALAARRSLDPEELWAHLDLVALATIADLVPLVGENRILVRFGLRYLAHTRKAGLRALLRSSGLGESGGGEIEAGRVGFVLAPRINAVGRMGDAAVALRLLLTEDPLEAGRLATELEEENRRRQEEDRSTLDQALAHLAESFDPSSDFGVVLEGEGWHPGVIGIVASRVVERIQRPAVLLALDGDRARGSARSISSVHLLDAVRAGAPHLLRFGGHRQAAGMELKRSGIPAFRSAFNEAVREQVNGVLPPPRLRGDLHLPLPLADRELCRFLGHLGPFGMGNPRPVFWSQGARVSAPPKVLKGEHLKLRIGEEGVTLEAIGFGLLPRLGTGVPGVGERVDALFHLQEEEFRGERTLQARLLDLRPSDDGGGA